MRTKLVPIGNSKGIRIPKAALQAAQLEDEVILQIEQGRLIIEPARRRRRPRAGWENAIREAIASEGAPEIDPDWEMLANEWDEKGWQW